MAVKAVKVFVEVPKSMEHMLTSGEPMLQTKHGNPVVERAVKVGMLEGELIHIVVIGSDCYRIKYYVEQPIHVVKDNREVTARVYRAGSRLT